MTVLAYVPGPPAWQLDWQGLDAAYEWVRALESCPQSPEWHAEGNVWIHTQMVLEALIALPGWRALPARERAIVFVAALLHDVAKPECTRHEPDGRITSRGHSRRGAILARELLWRMDIPFAMREEICGLILYHQIPFMMIERDDGERTAITVSQLVRCDLLALVAEADARGRYCADQARLLDNIGLYSEMCRELGCWQEPFQFANAHTRFRYFRDSGRSPHASAYDDTRSQVTLMSGLPGAGKDRWIGAHTGNIPVISLDAIRDDLDIDPADAQGRVIQEARERARDYLRAGQSFAWNATNLSLDLRKRVIDLCDGYKARVRIVYVETTYERLWEQNRRRAHVVPENVIGRLMRRWTVPTLLEAHEVIWNVPQDDHADALDEG